MSHPSSIRSAFPRYILKLKRYVIYRKGTQVSHPSGALISPFTDKNQWKQFLYALTYGSCDSQNSRKLDTLLAILLNLHTISPLGSGVLRSMGNMQQSVLKHAVNRYLDVYDKRTKTYTAEELLNTIIIPTLKYLEMGGAAAEELVLGTAIQESNLVHRTQIGGGPALGLYQMEPATHDDIWNNYLKYRKELASKVEALLVSNNKLENLRDNDRYATAMTRIHYARVKQSLPGTGDLKAQANYWKNHYNTHLGKGKVSEYIDKWRIYVGVK